MEIDQEMKTALKAGLPGFQPVLPDHTADILCAFGQAVIEQNKVMNLTAITDPVQVAKLHLLDSLTLTRCLDLKGKRLIDVGCGAGFPGVPIAIACPDTDVTLLDSLGKRVAWLEGILPELGISAHCVTARAEEAVASCRESFDVASSRAVARLNILLELLAPYVRVGGYVAALKGAAAQQELDECKNAMAKLGLKLESVTHFDVEGADHAVILLRKVAHTPGCYPRRYAKIKQSPL